LRGKDEKDYDSRFKVSLVNENTTKSEHKDKRDER